MSQAAPTPAPVPPWQVSIRARCVHPGGLFVPFDRTAIEQSVPQRFEQQVRQHAARMAVRVGARTWRYDELDQRANRVAHAILARRGAGAEPVALLFGHGLPFLAAILGVLKAGKFYVPLDPSFPVARLRYMVDDSQAALLVTSGPDLPLARQLLPPAGHLLDVATLPPATGQGPPGLSIGPETLAYVVYTSGSTGQPKGVMQNHRNLLHKTMLNANDFHLGPEDRRPLLSSPSSSGSLWDIFSALLTGGSLHPVDLTPAGLAALPGCLVREGITVYTAAPTLFRHVLASRPGEPWPPGLRLVHLSGEAVTRADVELYRARGAPACVLAVTLGGTETGSVSRYFVDHHTPIEGGLVPAGYPLEDKEVLLLDPHDQAVPPGEVGEIIVRGPHIALGYWRQPELTRAAFLPPGPGQHAAAYRTGDLGRLRPDGCLEYLGRKDSQVKVRGYRVELTEIEQALLSVGDIGEAVVVQQAGPAGEPRLVAYLVPVRRPAPTVTALRQALATLLPDHMRPGAFVLLDRLPLTLAGKVDRRALPAPDRARPELTTPFVAPRLPVETTVAAIWADTLGLAQVGLHDAFLDLGGHSIQATQIVARVVAALQVELPVQALFDAPTVAEMAAVVTRHLAGRTAPADLERLLAEVEGPSADHADHPPASDRSRPGQ